MSSTTHVLDGQLTKIPQDFPIELIREIFCLGSWISTKLAYNLCLVSYWARDIALPGLYAFASLGTGKQADKLCETIAMDGLMARPGKGAFRPNITAVDCHECADGIISILRTYAETLQHIAMPYDELFILAYALNMTKRQVKGILRMLRNRKKGLDILLTSNSDDPAQVTLDDFTFASSSPSLLNCITKIRLPELAGLEYQAEIYNRFFPSLTHVALPITYEDITPIIRFLAHPSLEVIVLLVSDDTLFEASQTGSEDSWLKPARDRNPRDIRIVTIRTQTDDKSLLHCWEAEIRGGKSIWTIEN